MGKRSKELLAELERAEKKALGNDKPCRLCVALMDLEPGAIDAVEAVLQKRHPNRDRYLLGERKLHPILNAAGIKVTQVDIQVHREEGHGA
jgi:hypothetical protein